MLFTLFINVCILECTLFHPPGKTFYLILAETQRSGRYIAENLYEMVYDRLLDSYCTPEIRYQRLMKRCPDLKDTVPLKSIASFLGVTPETVSRIRRKLKK